jgi:hypothetical protein
VLALCAAVSMLAPFVVSCAAAPLTLQVVATAGLPGFRQAKLTRFVAAQMVRAGLAEWRFAPATGAAPTPDRVEWNFKLNPYAGGEVRSFVNTQRYQDWFGRRPVTIEARLYLNGEYQTLVEAQAVVQYGPNNPDLAAAVVRATRNLLGPVGAYRAIDTRQHRAGEKR